MKKILFFSAIFLTFSVLSGQQRGDTEVKEDKQENYTLSGFRHGANFFPLVRLPQVEYSPGDTLGFNKYHSIDVIYFWLDKWAHDYPDLVNLYQVGSSFEERPILQITITNKNTGKDTDKPAAYFEGGRHSGEVTGSESALWLAKFLIERYGKDPDVTHIVDTKTIYIRPVNNPDGHELYLNTAQSNRSTVRPMDNDNDGLLDEDPPDDLNGDGMILTMRWKDDKKGNLVPDTADPTGRLMKRVPPGEGIYLSSSEGIDNDGDGRINEDGIGGLDLHRNYPENWRPMTEETGRGYTQNGAGEFPLSEPETRAVVDFLLKHPNVDVVNSMDTSMPMHLRPPSTSASEERMYPEDLELYKIFDEIGKKITGYEKAGDVYQDYGSGNPLFGHGPDFGYWYFGAIWYGDEIWNGGRFGDYNHDGVTDQLDMLKWDDEENDSSGFFAWKPARHPVYGEIEIGGFNPKFFSQNPPAKFLEKWAGKEALFNLEMIKYLPEISWDNIESRRLKSYKSDSADYQVRVRIRNTGKLPTALKQAQLVRIVRNDRIVLSLDTAGTHKTGPAFRLISEEKASGAREGRNTGGEPGRGTRETEISKDVPFTRGGEVTEALFRIRLYGRSELAGSASFYSTRGGILTGKEFVIK